jgi:protein phosphatase
MVCDGAGGGEAGELAARLTSRTIFEYLEISPETSVPKLLIKAVEEANKAVYSELQGTGTSTVALAAVHLNDGATYGRLYIANVGNSRIYLIREGRLVRLNIDHTLANEYVFAGQMSPEEAKELNDPNVTRSIGTGAKISVDIGFYAGATRFYHSRRASASVKRYGTAVIPFSLLDGLFFVQTTNLTICAG